MKHLKQKNKKKSKKKTHKNQSNVNTKKNKKIIVKKQYFTWDNTGKPFLVKINNKNNEVEIYKRTHNSLFDYEDDIGIPEKYTTFVKKIKPISIFIGKSSGKPTCKCCDHTSKEKNEYDGNSILLHIPSKHKYTYIFIGHEIYQFTTKDKIIKYYSPLGQSGVSYPVAIGKVNSYFMLDKKYISNKIIPKKWLNINKVDCLYNIYYGNDTHKPLEKKAKKMKNYKIIHKRLF